jgi:hypothetical protein
MPKRPSARTAKDSNDGRRDVSPSAHDAATPKQGSAIAHGAARHGVRSVKGSLADTAMTAVPEDELFSTEAPWNVG